MKIAVTVLEELGSFCLNGKALAFKVLEQKEAEAFIQESLSDGLTVLSVKWKHDFVPNQWDDRVVNYRV